MMTSLRHAKQQASTALSAAGWDGEDAQREARLLLTLASGLSLEQQIARDETELSADAEVRLHDMLTARLAHTPMAYLAGSREFFGLDFQVGPATLIPRPDSETLVEAVLADHAKETPLRLLDLGTGTGCLLLSLLKNLPSSQGVGTDMRPDALALALRNATALGLDQRARFFVGSWWQAVDENEKFDVIISNPPYIPSAEIAGLMPDVRDHEPHSALDGGLDGLDAYRAILSQAAAHLTPTGRLYFEIGAGQDGALIALAAAQELALIRLCHDLSGMARVVVFTHSR